MLRAGLGKSKGNLLEMADKSRGTMLWNGRRFPKSSVDGRDTPQALPAIEGVLPHLHADWRDWFPVAVACEHCGDVDPREDGHSEERGSAIGVGMGTSCGVRTEAEKFI